MKTLDDLVRDARDAGPEWNDDRAGRVLTSAIDRRERRTTRNRVARRAMVAASVVGVLGFMFLRGANASSASSTEVEAAPTMTTIAAAETLGDAGYARD
jgi:hypothetical protein